MPQTRPARRHWSGHCVVARRLRRLRFDGAGSASESGRLKSSVEKALALLQRSGAQFNRVSKCASCHHQFLPQMALGVARRHRGFGHAYESNRHS